MTIHVGALCKNIEEQYPILEQFITFLFDSIEDIRVCLYENNSTDNTKVLLDNIKDISPYIEVKKEDIPVEEILERGKARTWDNKPCRVEEIANARNKLCNMLESVEYKEDDLVLIFDSDMLRIPKMDILINILNDYPKDVNAIFSNGLTVHYKYYDRYALRTMSEPFGPEIEGDAIFWDKIKSSITFTEITPVLSAFGGMAIYKASEIRGIRYSAIPTNDLDDYYKYIAENLHYKQDKIPTHYDGTLRGIFLYGLDNFFYICSSGYNYPIICEHTSFHASLWKRGYGKFIIDPQLKYYSGHF